MYYISNRVSIGFVIFFGKFFLGFLNGAGIGVNVGRNLHDTITSAFETALVGVWLWLCVGRAVRLSQPAN